MARFTAKSGEIYFEHSGSRADPRVLFIQGLGCQVVHWPESLIEGVVDAGLCAVTFDNRDSGLSHGSKRLRLPCRHCWRHATIQET